MVYNLFLIVNNTLEVILMSNQRSKKENKNSKILRKINNNKIKTERPISSAYPEIDTDLARDNIENDLTSSDLQDL